MLQAHAVRLHPKHDGSQGASNNSGPSMTTNYAATAVNLSDSCHQLTSWKISANPESEAIQDSDPIKSHYPISLMVHSSHSVTVIVINHVSR